MRYIIKAESYDRKGARGKLYCIIAGSAVTLRQDDFEGFMASRQRMILAKIEAAMGKPVLAVDDSAYSDVVDEDE